MLFLAMASGEHMAGMQGHVRVAVAVVVTSVRVECYVTVAGKNDTVSTPSSYGAVAFPATTRSRLALRPAAVPAWSVSGHDGLGGMARQG